MRFTYFQTALTFIIILCFISSRVNSSYLASNQVIFEPKKGDTIYYAVTKIKSYNGTFPISLNNDLNPKMCNLNKESYIAITIANKITSKTGNDQIYARATVNRSEDYPEGISSQIINDTNGISSKFSTLIINNLMPYRSFPNISAIQDWFNKTNFYVPEVPYIPLEIPLNVNYSINMKYLLISYNFETIIFSVQINWKTGIVYYFNESTSLREISDKFELDLMRVSSIPKISEPLQPINFLIIFLVISVSIVFVISYWRYVKHTKRTKSKISYVVFLKEKIRVFNQRAKNKRSENIEPLLHKIEEIVDENDQ